MPEETTVQLPELKSDINISPQKPVNKFHSSLKLALAVIGVFAIIGAAYIVYISYIKTSTVNLVAVDPDSTIPMPTPTPSVSAQPVEYEDNVVLTKTIAGKTEDIYWFDTSGRFLGDAVRWNNLLIYPCLNSPEKFCVDDVNTGETTQYVIPINDSDPEIDPNIWWDIFDLSSVNIIQDVAYFYYSAYSSKGGTDYAVFKLPLNSYKSLLKLQYIPLSGQITNLGDHQVIKHGGGDGCGGFHGYALLDLQTYKSTEFAEFASGCAKGDQEVGYDSHLDGLIYSYFYYPENEDFMNGTRTYVGIVPIKYPTEKKILISQEDMPKNISYVFLDSSTHALILISETDNVVYNFDLLDKKLSKLMELPPVEEKGGYYRYFAAHDEEYKDIEPLIICSYVGKFSINPRNKKVTKNDINCEDEEFANDREELQADLEKEKSRLKLPSPYTWSIKQLPDR